MGLFRKLFGGSPVTDVMRLDILMDYDIRSECGRAALQWISPKGGGPEIQSSLPGIQAILIALLYGRILCIHDETREELFRRVGDLAIQNVRSEGATGFGFTPWILHVGLGGGDHSLWPWELVQADQMTNSKTYSAILKSGNANSRTPLGRWIHLSMSMGLERVLSPSSALIAITGFSRACDQETRYFLALLLWQMNSYWGSADRVSLGSEAIAYAAADAALRSQELRIT